MPPARILKSLNRALSGLTLAFRQEQNFRIQLFFSLAVMVIAWFLDVAVREFIFLISVLFFLLILELVNSAVEKLVDVIHPRVHHYAAHIKDLMAAAVLLGGIMAFVVVVWILGRQLTLWSF